MGLRETLTWGHAVGVYLSDGRLTLTRVAGTLGGTTVVARHQRELSGQSASEALKELLETELTLRQRRRAPICLGIGPEQTFFSTCPPPEDEGDNGPSPQKLLSSCGMGEMAAGSEAAIGHVAMKLEGSNAYSVAACRRDLADELFSAVRKAEAHTCRLEPGPWSVLRAAQKNGGPPRKWKTAISVLLGEGGGLAMLVVQGHPVLWRRFVLPAGSEARKIASAVRSLQVYALQKLGVGRINGLAIQGEAPEGLVDEVKGYVSMDTVHSSDQALNGELYSLGLALSARKSEGKCMDMFQALKPPPSLREVFPTKLAAFVLFIIGAMGMMLWDKSGSLDEQYRALKRKSASSRWAAKMRTRQIEKERKTLAGEVGAVGTFLSTRIIWSNYLRDLPSRLPPSTYLSKVWGFAELKAMSKKKHSSRVNRSLTLRGVTRFSDRDSAPEEIDAFLDSLRNVELLRRDFPIVTLAEIKWRREAGTDTAMFTVIAVPRKSTGAKK